LLPKITPSSFLKCYLVIALLIAASGIYPQEKILNLERYTVDPGVSTKVNCILQDRTGFLWFATNSGLLRYDGYSFMHYTYNPDDSTSLVDNIITTVYEDKSGSLWIGTYNGLDKLDPVNGNITHYFQPSTINKDNVRSRIYALCEDRYGGFWIGTEKGLYKLDRATGQVTFICYDITDQKSISSNSIFAICSDNKGYLWFGTKSGLYKYIFEKGKFRNYLPDKGWIISIEMDEEGIMWLGTTNGLVRFDPKVNQYSIYTITNKTPEYLQSWQNAVHNISPDTASGLLWISTNNGLLSFDKRLKKFTNYLSEYTNFACWERSGTLWAGTDAGIIKLSPAKNFFKKYPVDGIGCAVMATTDEYLWVFSYKSWWNKFDLAEEKFVPYSFGNDFLYYVYPEGDMGFLTKDSSFYIRDPAGKVIVFLDHSWKSFNVNLSFGWKTKRGYYIGTHSGNLCLIEPGTSYVKEIINIGNAIYLIYEDSFELLWLATYLGELFCYDQEKNKLTRFSPVKTNSSGISGSLVNEIYEDKKGRLWFATNNGLDRFERATGNFINIKAGFLSNNIRAILEDEHGSLWLNTSRGISRFDPETGNVKNYDIYYNLELPTDAYYTLGSKISNGEMFFGGTGGFTRFHPDSIKDNIFIPPVVITSFRKFEKPSPVQRELYLSYDENFLSFEFASLNYTNTERNQYAYMMEGLDKDWTYSGTRRFASFPGMNPGKYIFRVKSSNDDGLWNETGTSVLIIISPPWWKSTWAYFLYSVLILGLIYITWKMQLKRIRMTHKFEMSRFEAEKLHEVDVLKSRFFANISHEFRTPLTLILGPVKQVIEKTREDITRNNLKVVHRNAKRLLELVNELLDISKLESGSMNLQTYPRDIIPLLKALVQSFSSYAERKKITITFDSAEDKIMAYIDKDKIEKIFTNILSNAFKFTPDGGKVEVIVRKETAGSGYEYNSFAVSVKDSGIGIPEDKISKIYDRFYQVKSSHIKQQEGTGIGLSLTKELVELHKGKIQVKSEEGKGTIFTVILPLGKEYLQPEEICTAEEVNEERRDKVYVMNDDNMRTMSINDLNSQEKELLPLLLLVEDNYDVRDYIRVSVEKGYRFLEAVDGNDGWEKAVGFTPDLVVSDVMMPGMDGFQLCRKLKSDERTSHIPVILLTARASTQDKIEGLETGADDYIMKPFEQDELRARIRNLLEQRKRIQDYFKKHGLFKINEKNITPIDQKFLQKLSDIIIIHIPDRSFNVDLLAGELALSRSVLHRKIISLTGETPGDLMRRIRLQKAVYLIKHQNFDNISEIALEVGFSNPAYFAKTFKKQYGLTPSEFQEEQKKI
jgi:signal transduction histidine kinase/ligand-binding sensor domain-containing protein/DNA-binding NarL/FixJ family response regulator